jgi:anti-sigma B factor antagonist
MSDAINFSLAFSRARGKVVVDIYGALDAETAPELKDRLVDVIDGQGNRQLVLDLARTTHIDSSGISVLVDALKRMQRTGGELVLSGPTSQVSRALALAGLDKVFVITPAWAHPARGGNRTNLGRPAGWGRRG